MFYLIHLPFLLVYKRENKVKVTLKEYAFYKGIFAYFRAGYKIGYKRV